MAVIETVAPGAETPASMSNDDRLKKFKKTVRDLGTTAGAGKDALAKLAYAVAEAAADGIITNTKDKKSRIMKNDQGVATKISDVGEAYESYVMAEGTKAFHERSEKSVGVQINKLTRFYDLGALTNIPDIMEVFDDAIKVYNAENPETFKNKENRGAYEYYLAVAKAQIDPDHANTRLDEKELRSLVAKPEASAKTLEKELKRAKKILETLIAGEGEEGIKDEDERTEAAYNLLKERLEDLAKLAEIAKLQAKLAELGR